MLCLSGNNYNRHQLALSSREKEEHQQTIQQLRKDIENRKHAEDKLRAQHSHELEDTRQTLSSQENKVESQRQEVCKLRDELEERQTELATMREEERKREQELTESCQRQLQTQLRETKEVLLYTVEHLVLDTLNKGIYL
jgi:chromosome segregation ATPase